MVTKVSVKDLNNEIEKEMGMFSELKVEMKR